jgi:hypothetical protein
METNSNIEREIERSLETARGITPINAPVQFTEKTMQRIRAVKEEPFISVSVLLKAAAVLILICLNAYTIKYIFETPTPQAITVTATIDDLANDYTVADVSNDWLNNKITKSHE